MNPFYARNGKTKNRRPRRHQNVQQHAHQHPGQNQIWGPPIHPQAQLQQNPTLSSHDMNPYQAISSQSGIPQQGHRVAMSHAMMIPAQSRPQDSGTSQPSYYSYGHPVTHQAAMLQQQHMPGYNQQPAYQYPQPVPPNQYRPTSTAYQYCLPNQYRQTSAAYQYRLPVLPSQPVPPNQYRLPVLPSQPVPPTYFTHQRNQLPVTNAQPTEALQTQQKIRKTIHVRNPIFDEDITAIVNSPQPTQQQVKPPDADPKGVPVAIEFPSRVASLALSKDGEGERTNVSDSSEIDVELLSSEASDQEEVVLSQESTSSNFTHAKGGMELADETVEASEMVVVEEEPSPKMVVEEVPIVGSDLVVEQPKENVDFNVFVNLSNKEIEVGGASTSVTSTGGLQMATANSNHETSLPGPSNRRENDSQILILDHPTITTICEMCPAMVAIDQLATHIRILHIIPTDRYYNRVIANLLPDAARGA